jgi:methionine synthase II (cobalamin-independent)
MNKLKGLATGIGSLPHKDIDAALDLIFKYVPEIPFWPQLPKRDIREAMIAQFSENFPCLKITSEGLVFDPENKDEQLEAFYERVIADDAPYFKISEPYALGLHKFYNRLEKIGLQDIEFIKCQITGPFTFAAGISDENGIALLHDKVYMQAIIKALTFKALWQINLFRKFNKKIMLFVDEPYLSCFGSAYTPLNKEDVVKGLSELTEPLKNQDVLLGVHCCGNTDWSIFTDVKNLGLISFDAFEFLDRLILYADDLKRFFDRGGILCWGIVPTQLFSGEETPDFLIRMIKEGIYKLEKKGFGEEALSDNIIISPSCGLGTFAPEKAEKVFKLLSQTASSIRQYF